MESEKAIEPEKTISIDVLDRHRNQVEKMDLNAGVFDSEIKAHLIHQVVLYQQAKHRAGTASTKNRREVKASGSKPWRQKGTGRARSGARSSPLWHGGGVIFGPKPHSFAIKVPKKVRKAALRSAISSKQKEEKLIVVDKLEMERPATKELIGWLDDLKVFDKVLVLVPEKDPNAELSARNLDDVKVLRAEGLNVRDIMNHEVLIMTREAALKVQEALS
jgi:large subunit ribosomal protein L4